MPSRATIPPTPAARPGVDLGGRGAARDETVSVRIDLATVADLQLQLGNARRELERLGGVLDDASARLLASFDTSHRSIALAEAACAAASQADQLGQARAALASAITSLQFHDIATQMVGHALERIDAVSRVLGSGLDGGDAPPLPPDAADRPSPVADGRLSAGTIDLFLD